MSAVYAVGDRVRARVAVFEPADEAHPAGYLCSAGASLVVRQLPVAGGYAAKRYVASVSHDDVLDGSFWVTADEIEPAA